MKFLEYSCLEEVNTAISCVDSLDTRLFARIDAYSCKNTNEDKKLKHHIDEKYGAPASGDQHHNAEDLTPATVVPPLSPVFSPSAVSQAWSFHAGGGLPPGTPGIVGSAGGGGGGSFGSFGYSGNFGGRAAAAGGGFLSGSYGGVGSVGSFGMPSTQTPVSPYGPLAQLTSRKTLFYLLATLNAAFPDYDFSDVKPELFVKIPTLAVVQSHVDSTLFGMGYERLRSQGISDRLWEAVDEVIELVDADIYSFNPNPEIEPDSEEGNLWSFYYFFFNRKLKRIVFFTARAVSYMAPVQPEELANDIYGDNLGDEPMFDSEMGLSYEQYTMASMEV